MSRRALWAAGILLLWLGFLLGHARRLYFPPELTRLAEATLTLDPVDFEYLLRRGEEVVGSSSSRLDTVPEGFRLEDRTTLDLFALGVGGEALIQSRATLSRTLQLLDFDFRLQSEVGAFEAQGEVLGDSLLRVELRAPGAPPETLQFRISEAPLTAGALPMRVAKGGGLEVGRTLRFSVFDPSTLSNRVVEVAVLQTAPYTWVDSVARDPASGRWEGVRTREVQAWQIEERYGGVVVESWIDEDGRILRSSSPLGFSVERSHALLVQQARSEARDQPPSSRTDLILSTAIQANVVLAGRAASDTLRVRLGGVSLEGFDLEGGRQSLRGDTLVVVRERWEGLSPGYTLPYPRMDLASALEAEPLLQSGDPRILRAARELVRDPVGGRIPNDPRIVAERLTQGVYRTLRKEVAFALPSALSVLESGGGDCVEHTVLFVAMARALGLPARTAVGLVYLDGAFYYHAWPEVWLGRWVAVDPTLGEVPAGTAHLRFVHGTLARQVEIARLIGTLQIEILP